MIKEDDRRNILKLCGIEWRRIGTGEFSVPHVAFPAVDRDVLPNARGEPMEFDGKSCFVGGPCILFLQTFSGLGVE